jgi:predicted nucleotidyltransferase
MSNVSVPSPADTVRLEEHIVRRIRAALPGAQCVYLFGSRATGHARPDSDYDVAVLCNAHLPMPNNKVIGKVSNLETCVRRIHEVCDGKKEEFLKDVLRQESVLLNLQRACENVIDLANLLVATRDWGVPAYSRESFEMLEAN